MIVLTVEFSGWATYLGYLHQKNLWHGTAPFGRAARQAYGEALVYWHENILPRHFSDENRRYHYKRRKDPYMRIKKRLAQGLPVRGRHGRPIRGREAVVIRGGEINGVRSGQTMRRAKAGILIRTTPGQGTGSVQVPNYITTHWRADKPNQEEEIKTLTEAEVQDCSHVAGRTFFRVLNEEGRKAPRRKWKPPR